MTACCSGVEENCFNAWGLILQRTCRLWPAFEKRVGRVAADREPGEARGVVAGAGGGVAAAMVGDRPRDRFEPLAAFVRRVAKSAATFFKTQPLERGGDAADLAGGRLRIFPP